MGAVVHQGFRWLVSGLMGPLLLPSSPPQVCFHPDFDPPRGAFKSLLGAAPQLGRTSGAGAVFQLGLQQSLWEHWFFSRTL